MAEHHFISYGVCPSALTLAANLLGRTSRLAVGTAVVMLANRHPVAVAEETALLDHLSGGRFQLGVGRGGPWVDLEVFGTGLARYERGLAESLDLVLAALEGRPVAPTPGSELFRFRPVEIVPRPCTQPRPPVVVAATSLPTVDLAAALGLPLLLGLHAGDEEKAAFVARWEAAAERAGHDPSGAAHLAAAVCHIGDSRADAAARLRSAMPGWVASGTAGYVPITARPRPRPDPAEYVEHLLRIHPVGSPENCAERLAASAEKTGVSRYLLMVEGPGDTAAALETVARLGAEVAPLLNVPERFSGHCAPQGPAAGQSENGGG